MSFCCDYKKYKEYESCSLLDPIMPKHSKRIYLSAATTIEASIIIPIMVCALMTIMYFIQIIGLQTRVEEVMYNECRQLSRYAYVVGNNQFVIKDILETEQKWSDKAGEIDSCIRKGVGIISAETLFLSKMGFDYMRNTDVIGGPYGFLLLNSKVLSDNEEITLSVTYSIKNPFDIYGWFVHVITQTSSVTAWVGNEYNNSNSQSAEYVYITPTGTVYHKDKNCSYLNPQITGVDVDKVANYRNVNGAKYYSCEICGKEKSEICYITKYGTSYHSNRNCSGLKRGIMQVSLSALSGYAPCSKCSKFELQTGG